MLDAFDRALGREAHNLTTRSGLLCQQMYNRLQWEPEPVPSVLAAEMLALRQAGSSPWARVLSRPRESQSLRRTIAGGPVSILSCAISLDGTFIVARSDDRTLKIWDVATGLERATLAGHACEVESYAIDTPALSLARQRRER